VDSQGRWPGCTLVQIDHGGYNSEGYLRLICKINQIHRWGLTEFANGVLKSGAIVDGSATTAPRANVTSSSSSNAKRSGTSAPQVISSTKGTSVSKEPSKENRRLPRTPSPKHSAIRGSAPSAQDDLAAVPSLEKLEGKTPRGFRLAWRQGWNIVKRHV
jgi:hypothetical protein